MFWDLLDISQFPKVLNLKSFSNLRGSSYLPCFLPIITNFSLLATGRFCRTSKSLKILWPVLYYNNVNTNESIYDFILEQQDTSRKLVDSNFSFGGDFQCYIKEYLAGINAHDDENSKHLFYRYNGFLISKNIKPIKIRHTKTSEELVEIQDIYIYIYIYKKTLCNLKCSILIGK